MSSFIKLKHVQNIFATKNVDEMIIKKRRGLKMMALKTQNCEKILGTKYLIVSGPGA